MIVKINERFNLNIPEEKEKDMIIHGFVKTDEDATERVLTLYMYHLKTIMAKEKGLSAAATYRFSQDEIFSSLEQTILKKGNDYVVSLLAKEAEMSIPYDYYL